MVIVNITATHLGPSVLTVGPLTLLFVLEVNQLLLNRQRVHEIYD